MLRKALESLMERPSSIQRRAMLAHILQKLNIPQAQDVWQATAKLASSRGLFFHALNITRSYVVAETQKEIMRGIARRYSKKNSLDKREVIPPPIIAPIKIQLMDDERQLIELAIKIGLQTEELTLPEYAKMPEIPIFSGLSEKPFFALGMALKKVRLQKGDLLLTQGAMDRSLYLLSTGQVRVTQQKADGEVLELARVKSPAIIGEMSLLTSVPRRANVIVTQSGLAWQIDEKTLTYFGQENPDIIDELMNIVKGRLLKNLVHSSSIFADIKERELLLQQFNVQTVPANTQIFAQNAPPPGLYVILHGEAEVWMRDLTQERTRVATLTEGDAFGEFSLLTNNLTTAEVWMPNGGVLLHLNKERYRTIQAKTPNLENQLNNMMDIRYDELQSIVSPFSSHFEDIDDDNLLEFEVLS